MPKKTKFTGNTKAGFNFFKIGSCLVLTGFNLSRDNSKDKTGLGWNYISSQGFNKADVIKKGSWMTKNEDKDNVNI